MKRMNYGDIPLYEEFEKAFFNTLDPSGENLYEITIPNGNPDLQVMNYAIDILESNGFDSPEEVCVEQDGSPRAAWYFTIGQLYKLVETLIDIDPEHIEKMYSMELHEEHWPINFASSILYTLGFEWV